MWNVLQKAQSSNVPYSESVSKNEIKNDNFKTQISTATTKINSPHQEASNGALKLSSTQEPKPQVGAPLVRE